MSEQVVLFDLAEAYESTSLFFECLMLLPAIAFLLISSVTFVKALKNKSAWSFGAKIVSVPAFLLGLIMLTSQIYNWIANPVPTYYRKLIADEDYLITKGEIRHIRPTSIWAGDPIATFIVSDHKFTYGPRSGNFQLDRIEDGGLLRNGLSVEIWHKEGEILRIISLP